jgi:hypothetical protein
MQLAQSLQDPFANPGLDAIGAGNNAQEAHQALLLRRAEEERKRKMQDDLHGVTLSRAELDRERFDLAVSDRERKAEEAAATKGQKVNRELEEKSRRSAIIDSMEDGPEKDYAKLHQSVGLASGDFDRFDIAMASRAKDRMSRSQKVEDRNFSAAHQRAMTESKIAASQSEIAAENDRLRTVRRLENENARLRGASKSSSSSKNPSALDEIRSSAPAALQARVARVPPDQLSGAIGDGASKVITDPDERQAFLDLVQKTSGEIPEGPGRVEYLRKILLELASRRR